VANYPVSFSKTNRTWIVLCTVLALLIALAVWRSSEKATKMKSGTAAAGPSGFEALKPGDIAKIVLEVMESSAQRDIKGKLLEKQTDTLYTRTEELAEAAFDTNTTVLMGKAPDIHPGAILYVTGTVVPSHIIQARQIVVLTGYVQVR
jgi:hypothetical protein